MDVRWARTDIGSTNAMSAAVPPVATDAATGVAVRVETCASGAGRKPSRAMPKTTRAAPARDVMSAVRMPKTAPPATTADAHGALGFSAAESGCSSVASSASYRTAPASAIATTT